MQNIALIVFTLCFCRITSFGEPCYKSRMTTCLPFCCASARGSYQICCSDCSRSIYLHTRMSLSCTSLPHRQLITRPPTRKPSAHVESTVWTLSGGVIGVIVIGCLVAMAAVGFGVYYLFIGQHRITRPRRPIMGPRSSANVATNTSYLPQQQQSQQFNFVPTVSGGGSGPIIPHQQLLFQQPTPNNAPPVGAYSPPCPTAVLSATAPDGGYPLSYVQAGVGQYPHLNPHHAAGYSVYSEVPGQVLPPPSYESVVGQSDFGDPPKY